MKIELEFVELHSPLFIDGMNFGTKIYSDPKRNKAPVKIWYDTELRHTIVVYGQKVSMIESTASMTIVNPRDIGVEISLPRAQQVIPVHTEAVVAQVFDPTKAPPKTMLRKAKFQGEETQGE